MTGIATSHFLHERFAHQCFLRPECLPVQSFLSFPLTCRLFLCILHLRFKSFQGLESFSRSPLLVLLLSRVPLSSCPFLGLPLCGLLFQGLLLSGCFFLGLPLKSLLLPHFLFACFFFLFECN